MKVQSRDIFNGREWVVMFRVCYLCIPNILMDDNLFWIHSPYSHYMVLFTSYSLPLLFICIHIWYFDLWWLYIYVQYTCTYRIASSFETPISCSSCLIHAHPKMING